jgi:hypothetical protein
MTAHKLLTAFGDSVTADYRNNVTKVSSKYFILKRWSTPLGRFDRTLLTEGYDSTVFVTGINRTGDGTVMLFIF